MCIILDDSPYNEVFYLIDFESYSNKSVLLEQQFDLYKLRKIFSVYINNTGRKLLILEIHMMPILLYNTCKYMCVINKLT